MEAKDVKSSDFYSLVGEMVKQGWDPAVAVMTKLAEWANSEGPLKGLSKSELERIGRELKFYKGIPEMFSEVKEMIEHDQRFASFGITVEFYMISGGIEELVRPHVVASHMKEIWACSFAFHPDGTVDRPKRIVSFTEKTRYLFNIQKGFVAPKHRCEPYIVNVKIPDDQLRVPFDNMVYVGDGPTDIPCMSVLEKAKGHVVGILSEDNPDKTYASTYGRRAQFTIPTDYRKGEVGRINLDNLLKRVAESVARRIEYQQEQRPVPRY